MSGGNKTGIFVAAVKEGSPAYNEGLRTGDQVLMVMLRIAMIVNKYEKIMLHGHKLMKENM